MLAIRRLTGRMLAVALVTASTLLVPAGGSHKRRHDPAVTRTDTRAQRRTTRHTGDSYW